jgi:hypothetical protein
MASVLHGSGPHDAANSSRAQASQAPARVLTSQYGLNVKTVLKWRNRGRRSRNYSSGAGHSCHSMTEGHHSKSEPNILHTPGHFRLPAGETAEKRDQTARPSG